MIRAAALAFVLASGAASAQSFAEAEGGVIRWLDKLTGQTGDVDLQRGQAASNGRLTIQLDGCRYPVENPAAEAEAHLTILDSSRAEPIFRGWMLSAAPALSAMEHPRYDVWVLRCVVQGYAPPEVVDVPVEDEDSSSDSEAAE